MATYQSRYTGAEIDAAVDAIRNYTPGSGDSSGGGAGRTYSTNETLTGDVWIDGKPIYQKTYVVENAGGGANASVALGFDASILSTVISMVCTHYSSGNWHGIPISSASNIEGNATVYISGEKSTLQLTIGANRAAGTTYATIRYTKV